MEFVKKNRLLCGLAAVGTLKFAELLCRGICTFYKYFLVREHNLIERYGKCWAIVTGANGGIGLGYCRHLAARGFDILLLGRNMESLHDTATQLEKEFPDRHFEVLKIDFNKEDPQNWLINLREAIQDKDVGLLINVAGAGHGVEYQIYPPEKLEELTKISVLSTVTLTQALLPVFRKREKRSGILTISSICSSGKYAIVGYYGATRAFLDAFFTSLNEEVKDKIDVTTIKCGGVVTKMSPTKTIWHVSPDLAVGKQLQHLGHYVNTFGYWRHHLHGLMWDNWMASWHKEKTFRETHDYWKAEWIKS